jgi:hypothetical protein
MSKVYDFERNIYSVTIWMRRTLTLIVARQQTEYAIAGRYASIVHLWEPADAASHFSSSPNHGLGN